VSCLFFLACLFGLTFTDYMSRGWFASPRGTTMAGTQVTVGATPARTAEAPAHEAPGDAGPPLAKLSLEPSSFVVCQYLVPAPPGGQSSMADRDNQLHSSRQRPQKMSSSPRA
jgi:hypothetical protein